jgi:cold shock CspA family protein
MQSLNGWDLPARQDCMNSSTATAAVNAGYLKMEKTVVTGTVLRFGAAAYGWIKIDGTRIAAYVHIANVENRTLLQAGDRVSFDVVENERGPRAVNVKLLSGGAQ